MILVKNPSSWWILVSTSLILQQAATTVIGEQEIIIPLEPEITIPEVAASLLFPILPDQTILVSPVMEKDQLILGRVRVPETGHVRVTETQVVLGTHLFNNLALIVILQLHRMAAWKAIQAKINKSTKFPLILTDDLCNIITTIHTILNSICQLFVYIWSYYLLDSKQNWQLIFKNSNCEKKYHLYLNWSISYCKTYQKHIFKKFFLVLKPVQLCFFNVKTQFYPAVIQVLCHILIEKKVYHSSKLFHFVLS